MDRLEMDWLKMDQLKTDRLEMDRLEMDRVQCFHNTSMKPDKILIQAIWALRFQVNVSIFES